jgi:predicted RNase H-like nuclease (RuvC/YqgF family)
MSVRKKRPSAADVLRQEMQQPLASPAGDAPSPLPPNSPVMPTNPEISGNEAKLQQQIADLQSKLDKQAMSTEKLQAKNESLNKELDEAKGTALKLATQGQKTDTAYLEKSVNTAYINVRPVLTSAQVAERQAKTDIGWLD